ncbi:MAG: hypothetical protein R2861_02800 [Desulfobacterales bacterium]
MSNASAMLCERQVSHLALAPRADRKPPRHRARRPMVLAMDACGFGNCSNETECEAGMSQRDLYRRVPGSTGNFSNQNFLDFTG